MDLLGRWKSHSYRILIAALFLGGVALVGPSYAQESNQDSISVFQGRIVDSIVVDVRSIYDTSDPAYSRFLFRWANRLHRNTRMRIVKNEILLKVGSPYSPELADETERNLRRNLPIYDAWVRPDTLADGRLIIRVVTVDQWSLSGGFNIKREANEINYSMGLTEKNFLGHNQLISFTHFVENSEADHSQVKFIDNRLFGRSVRLAADYSDDPRLEFKRMWLSRPFYSLTRNISFGIAAQTFGGRRDVYNDEELIAQSEYEGDQSNVYITFRRGTYYQKGSARLEYKYRSEVTTDTSVITMDSLDADLAHRSFPVDSQYHELKLTLGVSQLQFVKRRRIDGFGFTEDFTLGSSAVASFSQAFDGDSSVYRTIGLSLAQGSVLKPGLLILAANGRIWYHRREAIRRRFGFSTYFYNQSISFLTLAFRLNYRSDWRVDQTNALILGGNNGLRGYDRFFKTGDRLLVMNVEGRVFPELELLSVLFGGAVFVDLGRTFEAGESLSGEGFYAAVGAGLRISFERSSRSSLFRCDVAYSEHSGWQLSISSGQFFAAAGSILALTSL